MLKKHEIVKLLSEKSGVSRDGIGKVLDALPGLVVSEINAGNDLVVPGLGKFRPKRTADRMGKNPKTGEDLPISAKNTVGFRASSEIRNAIAQ